MLVLFTIRWLGCKKDSIEKVCQIIIRRKLKLKLAAFLRWLVNNQYFTLPDLHLLVNKSLSIPNWKIARRVKILPCSRILRRIRRFILFAPFLTFRHAKAGFFSFSFSSYSRSADRNGTGQRRSHFCSRLRTLTSRRWLRFSRRRVHVRLHERILNGPRGPYLSASPRPLRASAIPPLNREHLAIYSRCNPCPGFLKGCACGKTAVMKIVSLFSFFSLSFPPPLSAYHRVTFLIPIARIHSPRGLTEHAFFLSF